MKEGLQQRSAPLLENIREVGAAAGVALGMAGYGDASQALRNAMGRKVPAVVSRLMPSEATRRGVATLLSDSALLWVEAIWKMLVLQVLVVLKTLVKQGHVFGLTLPASARESGLLMQRQKIP